MNRLQKIKVQMLEKFVTLHTALKMRLDTLLTELDLISIVDDKIVKDTPDASKTLEEISFFCENHQKILQQISNFGGFRITDDINCSENFQVFLEIRKEILYNLFNSKNFKDKIDNNLLGAVDHVILDLQNQRANVSVVNLNLKFKGCSYDEDVIKAALTEKGIQISNEFSEHEEIESVTPNKKPQINSKKKTITRNGKRRKGSWKAKNDQRKNNSANMAGKPKTIENNITENINAVSETEKELKYTVVATENDRNNKNYTLLLQSIKHLLQPENQVVEKGAITVEIPQLQNIISESSSIIWDPEKSTKSFEGSTKPIEKSASEDKISSDVNKVEILALDAFCNNIFDNHFKDYIEYNLRGQEITDNGFSQDNKYAKPGNIAANLEKPFMKQAISKVIDCSEITEFSFTKDEDCKQANMSTIDKSCRLNAGNTELQLENSNEHASKLLQEHNKVSSDRGVPCKLVDKELTLQPLKITVENASSPSFNKDKKVINEVGGPDKSGFYNKNKVKSLVNIIINNTNGVINIYNKDDTTSSLLKND